MRAQAEPFYKGKTIRIVVGSTAGGFYDRWARLFARYMGKHIPGQPEIIVQIMAGAGSVIATNHVTKWPSRTVSTLVMPLNGIYVDQFVGRAEAQYDLRKFHFIGSPAVESIIFYMRADAPYKSIADVIKAKEPPKCGSSGTASSDYILSKILEETVGAKFNSVLGYAGGTEIDIAVEKGEVVCRAHSASAHFGREPFDPGTRKILTAIWSRRRARETPMRPIRRRLTSSSSNIKSRPTAAVWRRSYWPREIWAVRSW